MTQEKLEQRVKSAWKLVMGFPLSLIGSITLREAGEVDEIVEREMVKQIRAELQKAAEIVESKIQYDGCMCKPCRTARTTAAEIRKLMD